MRNRRFTLVVPPFAIPQDELEFSEICSKSSKAFTPASVRLSPRIIRRFDQELEVVDLEDWLSYDKFPPLTPGQGKPMVSFVLPKHSQPANETRHERLHD